VGEPDRLRQQGLPIVLVQRVPISPSVRLALVLCAIHGAAAALLWLVPLPLPGKAVATAAVAVSLVYLLARDAALHAAHAIVGLEIGDGGRLSYWTRSGRRVECEVLDSSYVSPHLTIVLLRESGRARTRRVILLPDSMDPRDFRTLRVWLRWKPRSGAGLEAAVDR
jgi:toxin CptA